MGKNYGYSLALDASGCDTSRFTRQGVEEYLKDLCEVLDIKREDLYFWDYHDDPEGKAAAPPHMKGTSAVQFISKSTVVVHTLDDLKAAFVDIFTCGGLSVSDVRRVTENHFRCKTNVACFAHRRVG